MLLNFSEFDVSICLTKIYNVMPTLLKCKLTKMKKCYILQIAKLYNLMPK